MDYGYSQSCWWHHLRFGIRLTVVNVSVLFFTAFLIFSSFFYYIKVNISMKPRRAIFIITEIDKMDVSMTNLCDLSDSFRLKIVLLLKLTLRKWIRKWCLSRRVDIFMWKFNENFGLILNFRNSCLPLKLIKSILKATDYLVQTLCYL